MRPSPLLVMSFDRPDYLEKVLTSVRAQINCELDNRTIVLFQDGAESSFSGKLLTDRAATARCREVFEDIFPKGLVKESPHNLGVALNFDRAERYAFEELGAEAAIFLEDDLVLGINYISILDGLIETFVNDERVGYIAAYGNHTKSLEEQRKNRHKLILLGHNWGFALFRRQWLAMRAQVLDYLDTIKDRDYRDRDEDRVTRLFNSWGYGDPATSQDAAKTIGCCMTGAVKLNTFVCNATYIGERGLHMNEELFAQRGYSKTELYDEADLEFDPLDDANYRRLLAKQRDWAKSSRLQETLPQNMNFNPDDLIVAAYRSVLRREPDAEGLAAYRQLFGEDPLTDSLVRTINGMLNSPEFAKRWQAHSETVSNRLLLSLQKALLGRISSNLRGVTCGVTDGVITLRILFDGAISDRDRHTAFEIKEQISADFRSMRVNSEVLRADFPADLKIHGLQLWGYIRLEESAAVSAKT